MFSTELLSRSVDPSVINRTKYQFIENESKIEWRQIIITLYERFSALKFILYFTMILMIIQYCMISYHAYRWLEELLLPLLELFLGF